MIDALPLLNRVIELATQLGTEREEAEALGENFRRIQQKALGLERAIEDLRIKSINETNFTERMREFMRREDRAAANREAIAYLRKYFDEECPF